MARLEELLAEEFSSPDEKLALELAREDQQLLAKLINRREELGLSQQDIADTLGLSQATISAFERLGNDPRLSTVRRYARALGVMIHHHFEKDGHACGESQMITHTHSDGASFHITAAAVARKAASVGPAWPAESDIEESSAYSPAERAHA